MNDTAASTVLLQRLDEAIELMSAIRTSSPACTAAFDALKQTRARIAHTLATEQSEGSAEPIAIDFDERVAA
jgi:hypothetical protein